MACLRFKVISGGTSVDAVSLNSSTAPNVFSHFFASLSLQ